MRYAVTSQEMKIYDRNTCENFGVSYEVLMERASLLVAEHVLAWNRDKKSDRKKKVLVFAGTGNNGGDGVCAARILMQKGFQVSVCVVGDPTKCSELLLKQLKIAENYGIHPITFSNIRDNKSYAEWDIIVDALFGIGLSRNVTGTYSEAIEYINACKDERQSDLLVISVDMPSGISSDNGTLMGIAVKADETVTFNQTKIGQIMYPGCEYVGKLFVEDAGITEDSFCGKAPLAIYYDESAPEILPPRRKDGNKGTNGKVLIVAGSKSVSGACVLAATACIRMGAGMVRVFTAAENADTIKALIPEALLDTYEDYEPVREKLLEAMKWSTALVIGPGIGTDMKGEELLSCVIDNYDKDMVMDADALNLLALDDELRNSLSNYATRGKKLILTPHLAEFARLYKKDVKECKSGILEYPRVLAKELHCTVICKDARSIVSDSNSKEIFINTSGNDGMATAGSGDVLSGILGALTGSFDDGFKVACAGAYIHGLAGDAAAAKHGRYSMSASDIVSEIEDVLNS